MGSRTLRCALGSHAFPWPEHTYADNWLSSGRVFRVECSRGCGARTTMRCDRDDHWTYRHPEPSDTVKEQK